MSGWHEPFQIVALAAYTGLFAARTLELRLSRGVRVVTLVRGKPWREASLEALFLLTFPLWFIDMVVHAWPSGAPQAVAWIDPVLFPPGRVRGLGALLELMAVGIFAASLWSFGASWRVGVDRERPGELVTRGVFALSRNPIFLSMDLFLVGAVLMTGRLVPLLFALGALVGFHRQILAEERFLLGRYGEAYRAYCNRVGRYLGR